MRDRRPALVLLKGAYQIAGNTATVPDRQQAAKQTGRFPGK
jgi:hypothetical protein